MKNIEKTKLFLKKYIQKNAWLTRNNIKKSQYLINQSMVGNLLAKKNFNWFTNTINENKLTKGFKIIKECL